MAPDASALSNVKPAPAGTRQDGDTESFGFEKGDLAALSTPPKFDDVEEEKRYLKERLALACRIFAQYGLDHHVVRFIPCSEFYAHLAPVTVGTPGARQWVCFQDVLTPLLDAWTGRTLDGSSSRYAARSELDPKSGVPAVAFG
jgi:hypothetical protein